MSLPCKTLALGEILPRMLGAVVYVFTPLYWFAPEVVGHTEVGGTWAGIVAECMPATFGCSRN